MPNIKHYDTSKFLLIAGPCVIEGEEITMKIAQRIKRVTDKLDIPFVFKSSYKKANRSRMDSFTGIGSLEGLRILEKIAKSLYVPVITDVHTPEEAKQAARFVEILQIPAFLCRQTDLLVASGETGKHVNIKKGQFLSPGSMKYAADKVVATGNKNILLTERGTTFGYQDLVVDYRGIIEMKKTGFPVILDVTHSLQQPNQEAGVTGGRPDLIETIAKAGIAVGIDGIFIETHPDPGNAKSDGANMLQLDLLEDLMKKMVLLKDTVNKLNEM
ncbi:MAG: 3-deoxy-8-phosphooctulonate synthase [bacterium]